MKLQTQSCKCVGGLVFLDDLVNGGGSIGDVVGEGEWLISIGGESVSIKGGGNGGEGRIVGLLVEQASEGK